MTHELMHATSSEGMCLQLSGVAPDIIPGTSYATAVLVRLGRAFRPRSLIEREVLLRTREVHRLG